MILTQNQKSVTMILCQYQIIDIMPSGGYRKGSGRKSGWNHSETQTIRVPVVFTEQLIEIAKKLDNGDELESVSESYSQEQLELIVQEILSNPVVTRNGKDKAAIRRALKYLIDKLSFKQ